MAAAVAAIVRPGWRDATDTFINGGTSTGVVLYCPVALIMGSEWRVSFAAAAILAACTLPNEPNGETNSSGGLPVFNGVLGRLIAAAFLMGASSTSLWSFGSERVLLRQGCGSAGANLLWLVIGTAGVTGAGILIARMGSTLYTGYSWAH